MIKFENCIFINHLDNGREPNSKESFGYLSYVPKVGKPLNLFTVELPWKDNKSFISRIPAGIYPYEKAYSPRHKMTVIELFNVPNRYKIEIHVANYVRDLEGCIGIGVGRGDIDSDGLIDVKNSANALYELLAIVPQKGFVKIIDL